MDAVTNANVMPARTYKFPAAAELVNAMIGNLSANNANPEAIEAAKDARELASTPEATAVPEAQ